MAEPRRHHLPAVYLLALALPLGIAPAQVALGAGLLLWAGALAARRRWIRSPLDAPLATFLAVGFASALASADPVLSLRAALSSWTLLAFFLGREAANDPRTLRLSLRLLAISATAAATMAIVAAWSGEGSVVEPLLAWLDVPSPSLFGGRMTGFFSHPMTFAGQQTMLLILFATLRGPDTGGESAPRRGLRLLPVAATALGLVLSAARAAFGAATLALLAAVGLNRERRASTAVGLVLLVGSALVAGSVLGSRLASTGEPASGPGRGEMWFAALDMLRERPLLGVGPGEYRREVGKRIDTSLLAPSHAHSTPLQVAAETGLAGLAALLWIFAAFFAALAPRYARMRRGRDPRAPGALACLLAVAAFLLIGLFEHDLGDGEVAMLAAFLAGLPFGRAFSGKVSA